MASQQRVQPDYSSTLWVRVYTTRFQDNWDEFIQPPYEFLLPVQNISADGLQSYSLNFFLAFPWRNQPCVIEETFPVGHNTQYTEQQKLDERDGCSCKALTEIHSDAKAVSSTTARRTYELLWSPLTGCGYCQSIQVFHLRMSQGNWYGSRTSVLT